MLIPISCYRCLNFSGLLFGRACKINNLPDGTMHQMIVHLVVTTTTRKGQFILFLDEICTEFAFAHPKCKSKLLQIYDSSFYGSNLWDLYSKEFMSLCKTWNVAIRKLYHMVFQYKHIVDIYCILANKIMLIMY